MQLILLGLKHTGKTSLGRAAARWANLPFWDLDELLVQRADQPGLSTAREVARALGPEGFRQAEAAAAADARAYLTAQPGVLATGGGVIDNPAACEALDGAGFRLYLREDARVLFDRILAGGLPTFLSAEHPWEDWQKLYARRDAAYRAWAQAELSLTGLGLSEAKERLITFLKESF